MSRRWTDVFIERPLIAFVVNILIVVAGVQALTRLNVRQYPLAAASTINITTAYVGADAETVRGFVTVPIERALASADGVDFVESSSRAGLSHIQVRLRLNVPAAAALADISARVAQAAVDLPAAAQQPAVEVAPSDGDVASMYIAFEAEGMAHNTLTDHLERVVLPRLATLEGVQQAKLSGEARLALRIWLDPKRMAALNVAPAEVMRAIENNHRLAAIGTTQGDQIRVSLSTDTDLLDVAAFEALVVRRDDTALVRLGEVADVVLGSEELTSMAHASGHRAVFCGVWVQPTASIVEVLAAVRSELDALQAQLPAGIAVAIPYDATRYVERALVEVGTTLAETVAIVVLVLLLFLGSFRVALAPLVAIPLSLLGALFLMQLMGFSLNLLTLLAIVLAVGLVVDDAIVVVENVERYVRDGQRPIDAAKTAAGELIGPVIAMTVTLAAVYAPIGLQGGLTGALFREFAFTLAGAVCVSGVVALTLSPVMGAYLLRHQGTRGWLGRAVDAGFAAVRRTYGRGLDWSLDHRRAVLGVWVTLSLLVVPMYLLSPKALAPLEDQGEVFVAVDLPPNASLARVNAYGQQIDAFMAALPGFESSWRITTPGSLFVGLDMVPWEARTTSAAEAQAQLVPQLQGMPGVRATAFRPSALPSPGHFPVELVLVSHLPHAELLPIAHAIRHAAGESGQLAFPPIVDLLLDDAQTEVVLDRPLLTSLGLTAGEVGGALESMLGGRHVGWFERAGRRYKVVPQVAKTALRSVDQLDDVHVRAETDLVPLSAVARLEHRVGARSLNRFAQRNAVRLSGFPTESLDAALKTLEQLVETHGQGKVAIDYAGESRQLRQEAGKFLPAMGMAILLVFLVLAVQFNALRDPAVVLLGSVPLAMFGALLTSFLHFAGPPGLRFAFTEGWTTSLNIYAQVGLVTLVGLVAKNGILIVEHARLAQARGASRLEAAREAALVRLRPVLMTTVATVVGHFPLVLVTGPGAAARNAIGLVLVVGMSLGTLFTLFVVPSIYVSLAKARRA